MLSGMWFFIHHKVCKLNLNVLLSDSGAPAAGYISSGRSSKDTASSRRSGCLIRDLKYFIAPA